MNVVNSDMQFGALTMKLSDKSIFVAFAGTDSSIIGWEEDFKMTYLYPGASQKYASVYLNKAISLLDKKVRVGGHSKGGNLAICATMNAHFWIRKKVVKINVGAAALTYEEIGMNVDGMTLQIEGEDKVELQPTDKRAVFTFELQP